MFFLTRSAVCIGVVAILATSGDRTGMGRVLDGGGREAMQSLGRACMASSDCLRLGTGLVATMGGTTATQTVMPIQRSRDALTASDLTTAWAARGGRRYDMALHSRLGTLARL